MRESATVSCNLECVLVVTVQLLSFIVVLWQAICYGTVAYLLHCTIMPGFKLPTGLITGYSAVASEVTDKPPAVPISCSLVSISFDQQVNWLASDLLLISAWRSCHFLAAGPWHTFLLCWDVCLDATVGQVLNWHWWLVYIWCPCAMYTLKSEGSCDDQSVCVLNIRVYVWCLQHVFKELSYFHPKSAWTIF